MCRMEVHSEAAQDDNSLIRVQKAEPYVEEGDGEGEEERPLLDGSQKKGVTNDSRFVWSTWRRGLVLCILWLAQVVMTAAYSLIGPFFPLQVLVVY